MGCRRMLASRIAGLLLASSVLGGLGGVVAGPILFPVVAATADAATPTASPGVAGDTRSPGEGPGLVGSPLLAIVTVLALGGVATLLTLAYVRLTGARAGANTGPGESTGESADPGAGAGEGHGPDEPGDRGEGPAQASS